MLENEHIQLWASALSCITAAVHNSSDKCVLQSRSHTGRPQSWVAAGLALCSTYLTAEPCSTSEPTVVLNVKAPEVWQCPQPQNTDLVPLGFCSLLCIRATERNSIQDLWSEEVPFVQPKVLTQVNAACNFDTDCKLLSWCLDIVSTSSWLNFLVCHHMALHVVPNVCYCVKSQTRSCVELYCPQNGGLFVRFACNMDLLSLKKCCQKALGRHTKTFYTNIWMTVYAIYQWARILSSFTRMLPFFGVNFVEYLVF